MYYISHKNFKSNIKYSQYHYGSLDSQSIKFSALQVARSLLLRFTSILLTFSDRIIVKQQHMTKKKRKKKRKRENAKTKSIKCYSCFTLTTSKKFIVADEMKKGREKNWVEWEANNINLLLPLTF